jgi:hypothetical protein
MFVIKQKLNGTERPSRRCHLKAVTDNRKSLEPSEYVNSLTIWRRGSELK